MKKLIPYLLVIAWLPNLVGCAQEALPPQTPQVGYYTGTNPDVSFDVTPAGLENFEITCMDRKNNPIGLQPDGSFSDEEGKRVITGRVDGDKVSGHYTNDKCSHHGMTLAMDKPIDTDWTASFRGSRPTITPVPTLVPPKLGHYAGQDPIVSFDVTSAGVARFVGKGGRNACSAAADGVMSIELDGSFHERSSDNTAIYGVITGDTATGVWSVKTCLVIRDDGSQLFLHSDEGMQTKWTANWVGP